MNLLLLLEEEELLLGVLVARWGEPRTPPDDGKPLEHGRSGDRQKEKISRIILQKVIIQNVLSFTYGLVAV